VSQDALAVSLRVVDAETGAPIARYRWLVNLDNTNQADPRNPDFTSSLSVTIAKSHSPVLASGTSFNAGRLQRLPASLRYVISVYAPGYNMSTGYVDVGQALVTVRLVPYPLPLAQITVLAFHDNHPINSAPDVPTEEYLEGFRVALFDQGGEMGVDYWGNALGTTYLRDAAGEYVLDGEGNVQIETLGTGLATDVNGECTIKNIAPGKYGVRVVPPTGTDWILTSTIEGTPTVDAWVQENEPPFFAELGFAQTHTFYGFVLPQDFAAPGPGDTVGSVTGTARFQHQYRPPLGGEISLGTPGEPISHPYLGINNLSNLDEQVYVGQGNEDGTFSIGNIPPGIYQLVIWDKPLDAIIAFRSFIIPPAGGVVDLGDVLVPAWFGSISGKVFYDASSNGAFDPGVDGGLGGQAVNLRFKDGTIYQATGTDQLGNYSFDEVFPWFHWTVLEVDALRLWPTGVSTEADGGSDQPPLDTYSDTDPTLTLANVVYASQENKIDWGKRAFLPGENGGISGMVFYAVTRAENDPAYAAGEEWEPGIPNVTLNLYQVTGRDQNGIPIVGPLVSTTVTDSWDASNPEGCPGDDSRFVDCSETIRTWNQVRAGVFDGGYAFGSLAGDFIPPGEYVVEVVVPRGYEVVKEEDRNVDFGDGYGANPLALPPPCVGPLHVVPDVLSFDLQTEAPYAGEPRPLCTRKLVRLTEGQSAFADFFLFTQVPIPGKLVALVTDDLILEPNPDNPRFGDKLGPAFLPVSIQDYLGNEITRVYTDAYGQFEALLPSTIDINVPSPTGVSPNMVKAVTNHPGSPENPDPFYDPRYKTLSLNFDIWPGKTTYADIAIVSQSSFREAVGAVCERPNRNPELDWVSTFDGGGPYVPDSGDRRVILKSVDTRLVDGGPRDFGFGDTQGTGSVTLDGVALPVLQWSSKFVVVDVPAGSSTGQLIVTADNGYSTGPGITLHVQEPGTYDPTVLRVGSGHPFATIWDAMEAAADGDLILIAPGEYPENIIMYKKVKLQGFGAGSTTIHGGFFEPFNQFKQTGGNRDMWVEKLNFLIDNSLVDLVPGNRPDLFLEQGAAITVLVKDGAFDNSFNAQIDGLTILGAQKGGGVFVNGYARYLEISNNTIRQNSGNFGGGIRVGTPSIFVDIDGTDYFSSSFNENIWIHNNQLLENGGIDGGGGIALFNGSDNYRIEANWICGNITLLYGGGIDHFGLSANGLIQYNAVLFNEAFDEGGGIMIAGELPAVNGPSALTAGSGDVTVNRNYIQGNQSNDDGGGIRLLSVNGIDVQDSPADASGWHHVSIFNNMIVNNVSSDQGGGISLGDATSVDITHNTIAQNDSTGTGVDAFTGGGVVSTPLGAGIVDTLLSTTLLYTIDPSIRKTFTDPTLFNNIIRDNHSFHWDGIELVADPDFEFRNFQVFGGDGTELLNPNYCLLEEAYAGGADNVIGAPDFANEYENVLTATDLIGDGTFISVYMDLLALTGDYHILGTSAAIDAAFTIPGGSSLLSIDLDHQARPDGGGPDIGADEFY
jgi:hypothetical protein